MLNHKNFWEFVGFVFKTFDEIWDFFWILISWPPKNLSKLERSLVALTLTPMVCMLDHVRISLGIHICYQEFYNALVMYTYYYSFDWDANTYLYHYYFDIFMENLKRWWRTWTNKIIEITRNFLIFQSYKGGQQFNSKSNLGSHTLTFRSFLPLRHKF